jgi:hypothetical protein
VGYIQPCNQVLQKSHFVTFDLKIDSQKIGHDSNARRKSAARRIPAGVTVDIAAGLNRPATSPNGQAADQ